MKDETFTFYSLFIAKEGLILTRHLKEVQSALMQHTKDYKSGEYEFRRLDDVDDLYKLFQDYDGIVNLENYTKIPEDYQDLVDDGLVDENGKFPRSTFEKTDESADKSGNEKHSKSSPNKPSKQKPSDKPSEK